MKIVLKSLTLRNFKGVREKTIQFGNFTNIFGKNEAGKTTIVDAYLWLLFGKDSTDRKDFEIKTLDVNNNPFHRLEHEVIATLLIDGDESVIKRVYKEKWIKQRGELEAKFSGHETEYYWNNVPCNQAEYGKKISAIVDESLFKLISNTGYFNQLKWQERRSVLTSIAGAIDEKSIMERLGLYDLLNAISKKTVEEYKKEIVAEKKLLKEKLDLLPSRIEEAKRALPENLDYESVEKQITVITADIETAEQLMTNSSKAKQLHHDNIGLLLNKRQEITSRLKEIEFEIKNDVQKRKQDREQNIINLKNSLRIKQDELSTTRNEYSTISKRKELIIDEQNQLRTKWSAIDADVLKFNEGEFCCPACKRDFEADVIESKKAELQANFNADKSKKLSEITERGKSLTEQISTIETRLGNLKATGEALSNEVAVLSTNIKEAEEENLRLSNDELVEIVNSQLNNKEYQQLNKDVETLTAQINTPFIGEDNSELIQRKRELTNELDSLKSKLSTKGQKEKQESRINELLNEESIHANELARLEGIEFGILQFEKAKMNELESRVNSKFKICQFKLFETQINGGEIPCCETLIKGVPYADANTAAKIQAGIDIINTLSEHYNITAPIFIDNRESVTIIPESNSQLISLIVSPSDKELRIVSQEELEEASL